jgi:hypothetical protein
MVLLHENVEDDEDDFFGNQDDDDDEPVEHDEQEHYGNEFGALAEREHQARGTELRTIAYVESYDETKEARLQDGFEAGYQETFDVATRIGVLLGKATAATKTKLLNHEPVSLSSSDDDSAPTAARQVRAFLTKFEARPKEETSDAKQELENLEEDVKGILEK